jgi:YbbR domain-containing protein
LATLMDGDEQQHPILERLRRRVNKNLALRGLSLAIAIGLWIFVNAGQRSMIDELSVPISYRRLPAGLVIVNHPADFVKIQVTGPRTLLSLLDPDRLTVKLDLSGIGPGQASFKVNPAMFNVPRQTTVTSISPSEVLLDVDRVVQREVPVHVDIEGHLAVGYEIAAVQAKPPAVTVIGPSRYVNSLQQVNTEPFDVSGSSADVIRRVDLENPNAVVALATTRVDARVDVSEKISDREFRGVHVEVRDSDYKFRVDPNHASVVIRGPVLKLGGIDPNGLVFVDAKELMPGAHELPLQVNLPDGMQIVRQLPEKVRLRLYREKRSTAADDHTS